MSLPPIELDPYEGWDFPERLTNPGDLTHFILVASIDPSFQPEDKRDHTNYSALLHLLGGLAGAKPYGVQTEERSKARQAFESLDLSTASTLRNLGRVGFVNTITAEMEAAAVINNAMKQQRANKLVIIAGHNTGLRPLLDDLNVPPEDVFRAAFGKPNPMTLTTAGRSWTITPLMQ